YRAVGFRALLDHLGGICKQEGVAAEPEALELIAEAGEGSVRDALSLLDQAITHASAAGGEGLTAESVRALLGRVSPAAVGGLLDQVAADSARGLLEAAQALQAAGNGPAQLCWQLAQAVRNALLAQASPALLETSEGGRAAALRAAGQFREEELARFLQILLRAAADLRHGEQERLHFELALVKLLHARRLNAIEDVIASLQAGGTAPPKPASLPPSAPSPAPSTPTPPPSPAGEVLSAENPSARVRQHLEAQGKAALLSVVGPAQWDWQENRLTLVFAGENAAMASLAASAKPALAAACRTALGRNIEVEIAARPSEAAAAPPAETPLPGSPEERAAGHPLLRQLREQIPTHVLKTRTLAPSEGAR